MAKVIRVYGKADSYDIEFTQNGEKWEVDVPPDMTDGVYAVQLTAIDESGECAYWVGELYMVGGVCCLKIKEIPYRVQVKPKQYEVDFRKHKYNVSCCSSFFDTDFKEKYSVQIRKRKRSESNYVTEFTAKLSASEPETHCTLQIDLKETEIHSKTELYTGYTPNTKIYVRKGCCHVGK